IVSPPATLHFRATPASALAAASLMAADAIRTTSSAGFQADDLPCRADVDHAGHGGHVENERRSLPRGALDRDTAVHLLGELAGDVEPQAGARLRRRLPHPVEALE